MTTTVTSAHNNHALLSELIVSSYSKIVFAFARYDDVRKLRQAAEYTSRFMRVDRGVFQYFANPEITFSALELATRQRQISEVPAPTM